MVSKTLLGLVTAGVMAIGLSSMAMADAKASIEARQACMKANGAMIKVMVPMLKGQKPYDKAAIDAAIAKDQKACGGWADWWGADTMPDTPAGKAASRDLVRRRRLRSCRQRLRDGRVCRSGLHRRSLIQGGLPGTRQGLRRLP